MRFWILCVALTACGGIIDTGDAGNGGGVDSGTTGNDGGGVVKKDASTIDVVLPPPNCTPIQSETAIDSNGGCTSSATWSCGVTKYSVQCECPSTQCTCSQESGGTGTGTILKEASFCPKCDSASMPKICGFPTN